MRGDREGTAEPRTQWKEIIALWKAEEERKSRLKRQEKDMESVCVCGGGALETETVENFEERWRENGGRSARPPFCLGYGAASTTGETTKDTRGPGSM